MTVSSRVLEIEILSYWHPGTGRGDGAASDAVVQRTAQGLPVLPGRTVKGLLREVVMLGAAAGVVTLPNCDEAVFGSALPDRVSSDDRISRLENQRFTTTSGALRIGNAQLGRTSQERTQWERYAASEEGRELVPTLITSVSSTKLQDGVAADHTLRTIEVFVPVTLYAPLDLDTSALEGKADAVWRALSESVELFFRSLGSHRNRGLGRCKARIVEVSK